MIQLIEKIDEIKKFENINIGIYKRDIFTIWITIKWSHLNISSGLFEIWNINKNEYILFILEDHKYKFYSTTSFSPTMEEYVNKINIKEVLKSF